jgi:hypothetical protein
LELGWDKVQGSGLARRDVPARCVTGRAWFSSALIQALSELLNTKMYMSFYWSTEQHPFQMNSN